LNYRLKREQKFHIDKPCLLLPGVTAPAAPPSTLYRRLSR